MSEEVGKGKVIDVMNNYNISDIVVKGKFFTAKLDDRNDFDKVKKLGKFDVKLNSGRMLFDCEIDNQTLSEEECIIRGYFVKFE